MAEYIATGTTVSNGSDFTLTDGQTVQLGLFSSTTGPRLPADCQASVQSKTSSAGYIEIGRLTADEPVKLLQGPGTFRVVRRGSGSTSFGVDKS